MKFHRLVFIALLLFTGAVPGRSAESNAPAQAVTQPEQTNSLEVLRSYLQLQEQIHATQLAIEENRKEMNLAAARNAELMATRLQTIEQALVVQRERDLEALQSFQRVLLTVAGVIATLGFLAMVLMAYSHWRTMNRFAEIATGLPVGRRLAPLNSLATLERGDSSVVAVAPVEESSSRLLGAIDRLEKRIQELEHTSQAPVADVETAEDKPLEPAAASGKPVEIESHLGQISVLLGKGQSLLNVDKAEEALACFDQVLALNENHTEALVKKGMALERLRKNTEAIACYDRAIALDSSMTIAYLYKGGLFNRLERFSEAIECYEKALRTQEKGVL